MYQIYFYLLFISLINLDSENQTVFVMVLDQGSDDLFIEKHCINQMVYVDMEAIFADLFEPDSSFMQKYSNSMVYLNDNLCLVVIEYMRLALKRFFDSLLGTLPEYKSVFDRFILITETENELWDMIEAQNIIHELKFFGNGLFLFKQRMKQNQLLRKNFAMIIINYVMVYFKKCEKIDLVQFLLKYILRHELKTPDLIEQDIAHEIIVKPPNTRSPLIKSKVLSDVVENLQKQFPLPKKLIILEYAIIGIPDCGIENILHLFLKVNHKNICLLRRAMFNVQKHIIYRFNCAYKVGSELVNFCVSNDIELAYKKVSML